MKITIRVLTLSLHLLYLSPVYGMDPPKQEVFDCAKALRVNDQLDIFVEQRKRVMEDPTAENYQNALASYSILVRTVARNGRTTRLHEAARGGDIATINDLVTRQGVDVDIKGVNGATPLSVASADAMQQLLELGANANAPDVLGVTPLHELVAFEGRPSELDNGIQLLLDHGANIEAPDLLGNTPIIHAAINGNFHAFHILRANHASLYVNSIDAPNALIAIYAYALQNYIKRNPNDNSLSSHTIIPEDIARKNRTEMVRLILDEEPSLIHTVDPIYKATALHWASIFGDTDVIKLLLDKGLSPIVTNGDGETPLHVAARSDQVEAFRILRNREPGALAEYDSHQRTPIESARHHNAENVLRFIGNEPRTFSIH